MAYTVLKNGETYDDLLALIDAKTQESDWFEVFEILYPEQQYRNKNPALTYGEPFYNNIDVFTQVEAVEVYATKLPYQDFVDAFDAYIQVLKDMLTVWFDDEQYKVDTELWFSGLKHVGKSFLDAGVFALYNTFNPALALQGIIDNKNTAMKDAVDTLELTIEVAFQFEASVQEKGDRIKLGNRVIAIINHLNDEKGITTAQLTVMFSSVYIQQIMSLLQTGSLGTARGAIAALDISVLPPVIQSDIDLILGELDAYLG